MNFKNIHIGTMIKQCAEEQNVNHERACAILSCTTEEIEEMYTLPHLPADLLLKWSKLLQYDFFRIYSQHLILYSPLKKNIEPKVKNTLPQFRKNIYTQQIIDFILNQIETGEITISDTILRYKIPKTTLYKWITKHKK